MIRVKNNRKQIKQWFRNLSFRKKLVCSYAAVIIIPLLVLGISNYYRSVSILKQQLNSSILSDRQQISMNLENTMINTNEFIRFITFSPYLVEELEQETIGSYKFIRKLNSYFEPLIWYNLNINKDMDEINIYADQLSNNTGYFFRKSDAVKDQNWYKKACKTADTVWYFENGELYGSRRMFNKSQNKVIGVLRFRMNTEYVMENCMVPGEAGNGLLILGEDNQILYEYDKNPSVDGKGLMEQFMKKADSDIADIGGYYCALGNSANAGWKLFYYTSVNEYLTKTREILWFTLFLCFLCLGIVFGIIVLFSKYFVKRINLLSSKISQIEEGSLDVEINSGDKDEIGYLYNSFGHMLGRIRLLVDKVHEEEQLIREAELKSLQSLINPHFLYNALSHINWSAIACENENIAHFTEQLAVFYRTCLNKGMNLTTVEKEINNIKAYIEIQMIMHDNSFQVEYRLEEGLKDYTVINFVLQPLVENAIIHGVDEKEDAEGLIILELSEDKDRIILTVEDNGIGMEQKKADKLITLESEGYGLKNVHDRINHYYGESYGLRIQSEPGRGTRAELVIPKI